MSMLNKFSKKNDATGRKSNDSPIPQQGQVITLDLANIDVCDLNPRKTKGNHYESTKESIKVIGLQSQLTVTKRPGTDNYTLYNGGNTRLTILKELYEEYIHEGDNNKAHEIQFQTCFFKPYTDDLDVLVKHMAENEERSDMTFIDKARAVFQIKEIYLQQNDGDDISFRKLVDHIHSLGWRRINFQSVTELRYAYEKLQPILPMALNSGMGKPRIQKIRRNFDYTKIYLEYLLLKETYNFSIPEAEKMYLNIISQYDDDIDPINPEEIFKEYLFCLAEKLMTFDRSLTAHILEFEIDGIKENGCVKEPEAREEQSKRLFDTAEVTVPSTSFPPEVPKTEATDKKPTPPTPDIPKIEEINNSSSVADNQKQQTVPVTEVEKSIAVAVNANNEDVTELCISFSELFEPVFNKLDITGKMNDIFSMQNVAPFALVDVSTNEQIDENKLETLEDILLTGELSQQYFVMHCLHVSVLYFNNVYEQADMTDDERKCVYLLNKTLSQNSIKYLKYSGLCEIGLVDLQTAQINELKMVHSFSKKHLAMIHTQEISRQKTGA